MRLNVRVIPRSKKVKVEPYRDGLKIHLNEPALEGRANKKLIEILAQQYQVKKRDISIVSGQNSRDKVVEISGVS